MLDGAFRVAVQLVPLRRPTVETSNRRNAFGPLQLPKQQLTEGGVIAVLRPLPVERDQEQVRPLEVLQPSTRAFGLEYFIADPTAELIEHG